MDLALLSDCKGKKKRKASKTMKKRKGRIAINNKTNSVELKRVNKPLNRLGEGTRFWRVDFEYQLMQEYLEWNVLEQNWTEGTGQR